MELTGTPDQLTYTVLRCVLKDRTSSVAAGQAVPCRPFQPGDPNDEGGLPLHPSDRDFLFTTTPASAPTPELPLIITSRSRNRSRAWIAPRRPWRPRIWRCRQVLGDRALGKGQRAAQAAVAGGTTTSGAAAVGPTVSLTWYANPLRRKAPRPRGCPCSLITSCGSGSVGGTPVDTSPSYGFGPGRTRGQFVDRVRIGLGRIREICDPRQERRRVWAL